MNKSLLFGPLTLLTACGGSGGPTTVDIAAGTDSIGGAATEITFDPATEQYTVAVDGTEVVMDRLPAYDNGTFLAARGASDLEYGLYVSEGDNSSVVVFRPNFVDITGGPSTSFVRTGPDTLPTSGTATLTGDYQGIVQGGTATDVFLLIDGDMSLEVDFDDATISGSITDRIPLNPETNGRMFDGTPPVINDLELPETAISETGTFGGVIDSGAFELHGDTAVVVDGAFEGLLADNGTEAVGGVSLIHAFGFGGFLEVGAFAAGH